MKNVKENFFVVENTKAQTYKILLRKKKVFFFWWDVTR